MLTTGAAHALRGGLADLTDGPGIARRRDLSTLGVTHSQLRANLVARRWRRFGSAIVLHPGPLTREQRALAACFNCGPRAVLTAFTAAELSGLSRWSRSTVHVLAPSGTRIPSLSGIAVRLHCTDDWDRVERHPLRPIHRLAPALVVAASTFAEPRPACGILAAGVQQRLVTVTQLRRALLAAPRVRHRRALQLAVEDVSQGAHALSEIDFVRLCRRHQLPTPSQQAVRVDDQGRRRYLDAWWTRGDGRHVAVEVDGAIHLNVESWRDELLRQNDIVLSGVILLRFPSVVVRHEPEVVVTQLRRALQTW